MNFVERVSSYIFIEFAIELEFLLGLIRQFTSLNDRRGCMKPNLEQADFLNLVNVHFDYQTSNKPTVLKRLRLHYHATFWLVMILIKVKLT